MSRSMSSYGRRMPASMASTASETHDTNVENMFQSLETIFQNYDVKGKGQVDKNQFTAALREASNQWALNLSGLALCLASLGFSLLICPSVGDERPAAKVARVATEGVGYRNSSRRNCNQAQPTGRNRGPAGHPSRSASCH